MRHILGVAAVTCRGASHAVKYAPHCIAGFLFLNPVSPHMRIDAMFPQTFRHCTYIGAHGVQTQAYFAGCPALVMYDTRGRA